MIKVGTGYRPLVNTPFTILTGTHEEKEEWVKKKYGGQPTEYGSGDHGNAQCITVHHPKGIDRLLWFEKISLRPEELGLIVHELLHFTFAELKDMGIKHCEESEEIFTYYLQNLIVNIFSAAKVKK